MAIIKVGKGKKAVDALSVVSEQLGYRIVHIPTNRIVGAPYKFLSTARIIALNVVEQLGSIPDFLSSEALKVEATFPKSLILYINAYVSVEIKQPPSYDEFLASPDYEQLSAESIHRAMVEQQKAEYAEELCTGDFSMAWFPDERGTVSDYELTAILEGKPIRS